MRWRGVPRLVVALAIAVALLMTGHSGALVAQAGSTAVLIATLSPMVIQLRTAASDVLRATGYEPDTANRMVREAVALRAIESPLSD